MYPGKRLILIFDNAAYYHGMPDEGKSPLQDTKENNAAGLCAIMVSEIEMQTGRGIQ